MFREKICYSNLENGNYVDIGNNSYSSRIEKLLPVNIAEGYKVDISITNELENVENIKKEFDLKNNEVKKDEIEM